MVTLMPFTWTHVSKTFEWVSNDSLRNDFMMRGTITAEGHEQYFNKVLQDQTQRVFAILNDDVHIGNCGFKHIDKVINHGELWIYIGAYELHGKGVGKKATSLLLESGFIGLGFNTIFLHVGAFNSKAIAVYEKLGFGVASCNSCIGWDLRKDDILHMELTRKQWQLGQEKEMEI